jgi:polyhydroxybutyrate depolymerase
VTTFRWALVVALLVPAGAACSRDSDPSASTASASTTSTTAATSTTVTVKPPVRALPRQVTHGTIEVDRRGRTYRLYVPSQLPAGPIPLFVALHGGTGWGDQFATTNHVEGLAESNGFIVVHPDGVKVVGGRGGVWNGGVCCGVAARQDVDDVKFIEAVIDRIGDGFDIDPHRVFAFGHSNGGIMSYRLACELPDRIVGIGVVAGTLGVDRCLPDQPVSVMHIHGDADRNLPLAGGRGNIGVSGVDFPPPRLGFATLASAGGCPSAHSQTTGDVKVETREPCRDGTAAVFVTIATARHAWPGGTPILPPASGPGYPNYDATTELVTFLLNHPRP